MFRLRPLAVGLIALPRFADSQVRRRARSMLIEQAEAEGYAVAEVFELDGRPVKDDASLAALESLTERIGSQTVITLGPLSQESQARLTLQAELSILRVLPGAEPH